MNRVKPKNQPLKKNPEKLRINNNQINLRLTNKPNNQLSLESNLLTRLKSRVSPRKITLMSLPREPQKVRQKSLRMDRLRKALRDRLKAHKTQSQEKQSNLAKQKSPLKAVESKKRPKRVLKLTKLRSCVSADLGRR